MRRLLILIAEIYACIAENRDKKRHTHEKKKKTRVNFNDIYDKIPQEILSCS